MQLIPIKRKLVLSIWDASINIRFIQLGFTKGRIPSRMKTSATALSKSVNMVCCRYQRTRRFTGILSLLPDGENRCVVCGLFTRGVVEIPEKVGIRFKQEDITVVAEAGPVGIEAAIQCIKLFIFTE